ncbi:MAG: histidine utilization repressor [Proteobacteria bacterium]|nr:histidine utilization repressor [Pseudomonadota bacterium]
MAESPALPRYLEIQRDLQEKIASGEWGPGSRVPAEHELQALYQCSRMTVNKAISALAGAGLITRRRRSGSFVASPKSHETILQIHDIQAEIAASGRPYRFEILARQSRKMTDEDAKRLGLARSGEILALVLVHFAANRPFVHEERLLNLAVVPDAATESFSAAPPGTWLLGRVPWTDAEHTISAEAADAAIAARLGIPAGAPCLVMERRTWQAGATITWARLTYPGATHSLTSRFSPGGAMT